MDYVGEGLKTDHLIRFLAAFLCFFTSLNCVFTFQNGVVGLLRIGIFGNKNILCVHMIKGLRDWTRARETGCFSLLYHGYSSDCWNKGKAWKQIQKPPKFICWFRPLNTFEFVKPVGSFRITVNILRILAQCILIRNRSLGIYGIKTEKGQRGANKC